MVASRKLSGVALRKDEPLDVTLAYLKGKDAESRKLRNMRIAAAWRCMHRHIRGENRGSLV
jgi:hypothetical protein